MPFRYLLIGLAAAIVAGLANAEQIAGREIGVTDGDAAVFV